jgi:hypothetical protein
MTATTYYATTAEERLAEAQRILDKHITSSANHRKRKIVKWLVGGFAWVRWLGCFAW